MNGVLRVQAEGTVTRTMESPSMRVGLVTRTSHSMRMALPPAPVSVPRQWLGAMRFHATCGLRRICEALNGRAKVTGPDCGAVC